MAALTRPRLTDRLGDNIHPYDHPIAADTKVWQGSIACLDGTNKLLVPGSATTGLICVGRARDTYDNTGGAASAFQCAVDEGVFYWDNDPGAGAIAQADVGNFAYILDDHTVTKTATGHSVAGRIVSVDARFGIAVEMRRAVPVT